MRKLNPARLPAKKRHEQERQPLQQAASQLDELHWDEETGPVRRCALTRTRRPKEELIRFVLGPDCLIVPDLRERLPGRGVWLTASEDCVAEAAKCNAFSSALKTKVSVPSDLAPKVDQLLAEAALSALAIANKAGQVVFGFAKIEEAIAKGAVIALLHAKEASEDGCRKLDGKFRVESRDQRVAPSHMFSTDELGLASGRTNVIHAALIQGGAALALLAAASRLERYRKGTSAFAKPIGSDTDRI
ncbi:MAG TPA: RNA-binding protein [Methyloceanibacter sp.]